MASRRAMNPLETVTVTLALIGKGLRMVTGKRLPMVTKGYPGWLLRVTGRRNVERFTPERDVTYVTSTESDERRKHEPGRDGRTEGKGGGLSLWGSTATDRPNRHLLLTRNFP